MVWQAFSTMCCHLNFWQRSKCLHPWPGVRFGAKPCLVPLQGSSELYLAAVEVLETEGKAGMAGDIYRAAVGSHLRRERWADAVGLLLRWALACQGVAATASQNKAYLGAIIVWLYGQDAGQAWLCFQVQPNRDHMSWTGCHRTTCVLLVSVVITHWNRNPVCGCHMRTKCHCSACQRGPAVASWLV
jgi:hypothetical protein